VAEDENSKGRNPDPIGISRACPPQADKNSDLTQKLGKLAVFVQALFIDLGDPFKGGGQSHFLYVDAGGKI
jgi:hypothetical protein